MEGKVWGCVFLCKLKNNGFVIATLIRINRLFVDVKACHSPLSVDRNEVFKFIALNLRKMCQEHDI